MKFQITMQDDLLLKVNSYANSIGISRSSAISVLCSMALTQNEAILAISDLTKRIEEINNEKTNF